VRDTKLTPTQIATALGDPEVISLPPVCACPEHCQVLEEMAWQLTIIAAKALKASHPYFKEAERAFDDDMQDPVPG
jgi:hypothetical protein